MKITLSLIGASLALIGAVLISATYPLQGLSIWILSNVILGYVNKADKNQLFMYMGYEVITVVGVYNYMVI